MLHRITLALSAVALLAATPAPRTIAPATMPHPVAMFLASLSDSGKQKVTFKAAAIGTRFFFEEPGGVTVYSFAGEQYRKEAFLKGYTLARAMKRYGR